MCAMCCVIGGSEKEVAVSSSRIRVSGMLSRGSCGMILTTKVGELWIVETEMPTDNPVGSTIVDEGTIAGVDRLRADWVGKDIERFRGA